MQCLVERNTVSVINHIQKSIATRKALVFRYTKRDSYYPCERMVVFHRMYEYNGHRYAKGYCLTRNDMRTFRLDRFDEVIGLKEEDIPETLTKENGDCTGNTGNSHYFTFTIDYPRSQMRELPGENNKTNVIERPGKRKCRTGLVIFLFFCAVILSTVIAYNLTWPHGFRSRNPQLVSTGSVKYLKMKGTSCVVQKPIPVSPVFSYREFTVIKENSGYFVEELEKSFETLFDAVIAVNATVYIRETGILNYRLIQRYIDADIDRDGILAWSEIKIFQRRMQADFAYRINERALRPDEFLEEGGGDCEDFALFTAGLLFFWNYEACIGILDTGDSSHAVTLVLVDTLPRNFKGYYIADALVPPKDHFIEGLYTVIDYYRVGNFTKASGKRAQLAGVMMPQSSYGRAM